MSYPIQNECCSRPAKHRRKKREKALAAAAVIFMLLAGISGCALTNPTNPYAPVSGYAGGAGVTPALSAQLQQKLKEPLNLENCIEVALANNPQIGRSSWDAEAAHAQKDVAAAQRWPSLDAVAGYRHYLDGQRLISARKPNEGGVWSSDIFSSDLVVSMPLFTGGRIVNEIGAAELLWQAANRRLARTKDEIVFNVSSTFFSILGQRRVIESLEFSKKALEEHRKRVQNLMTVQKAAKVDLLRTEVRLADLEQKLVRERNILAIQQRLLANLMGVLEEDTAIDVKGILEITPVETNLKGDIERACDQREDYLAARAELEGQAKRVDAARAGRWPVISLNGSYGGRMVTGEVTRQPGAREFEDVGSAGLSLSFPLFEGGRIDANIRRERARLASAQEGLLDLELKIRLDVQTAVLNLTSSLERVRATEKAIEQARESLRIEAEKYELGKGSITDVLDSQSALLEAETSYARALAEYNVSVSQYRFAIGERQ